MKKTVAIIEEYRDETLHQAVENDLFDCIHEFVPDPEFTQIENQEMLNAKILCLLVDDLVLYVKGAWDGWSEEQLGAINLTAKKIQKECDDMVDERISAVSFLESCYTSANQIEYLSR